MPNSTSHQKFNWYYLLIVASFIGMIYISLQFFRGSNFSAVGITEAKAFRVNAEKAATIKTISVTSGQIVAKDDTLLILESNDLAIEIVKITNKISLLKIEQNLQASLLNQQVAYVEANDGISVVELNADIEQLKKEVALTERLIHSQSAVKDTTYDANNFGTLKLNSLTKQQQKQQEAIVIKKDDLRQKDKINQQQLSNQILLLEQELGLLKLQQNNLIRLAPTSGVIETIYVKVGEQVPAYSPLVSLSPLKPTKVIGFLTDRNIHEFILNDSVQIISSARGTKKIKGKIIGYGGVTELPPILQKATATKAFGREMFIEIDPENNFAHGEKVLIK